MLNIMTDDERAKIRQAIRDNAARTTSSPEAARAALVRMGIVNPDGSIAAEYKEKPDDVPYRS